MNALFKDGLRLSDISVNDAERRHSHSDCELGVIIAKLKNRNDKQRVMKEESRLKDNRQLIIEGVYPSRPGSFSMVGKLKLSSKIACYENEQ